MSDLANSDDSGSRSQRLRQRESKSHALGLFDGFEAYRTPTEEDYHRVLNSGLVVLDTNVLLNLYRYNTAAQDALFRVLEELKGRLWIPHQVASEFWRNRETASEDFKTIGRKTVDEINNLKGKTTESIRSWANRVSLEEEKTQDLESKVVQNFDAIVDDIQKIVLQDTSSDRWNTNKDPILQRLLPLLRGKVGSPPSKDALEAWIKEAERRASKEIPPGYLDDKKPQDRAAGDYLVWVQALDEAASRSADLLLVTGDVKSDWWRIEHGKVRGPRLELASELEQHTGGSRLFMLRPESLLVHARKALKVDVSDSSVEFVERVDRNQSVSDLDVNDLMKRAMRQRQERDKELSDRHRLEVVLKSDYIDHLNSVGWAAYDFFSSGGQWDIIATRDSVTLLIDVEDPSDIERHVVLYHDYDFQKRKVARTGLPIPKDAYFVYLYDHPPTKDAMSLSA